jgi:hypothetical protein
MVHGIRVESTGCPPLILQISVLRFITVAFGGFGVYADAEGLLMLKDWCRGNEGRRGERRPRGMLRGGRGFDGLGVAGDEGSRGFPHVIKILAESFQAPGGFIRSKRPEMADHHQVLDEVFRGRV